MVQSVLNNRVVKEMLNLRRFLVVLFVVLLGLSLVVFAGQEGKLSPMLRELLSQGDVDLSSYASSMEVFSTKGLVIVPVAPGGEGADELGVLVKLTHPFFGASFLGLPVMVSTGTILGMRVPLAGLLTLIGSPDVIYVEPAWKAEPKLDVSAPAIGASLVHAPPTSDIGANVIVGAVDTGIDYMHLDFRYDSDGDGVEESSRILSIWDQTSGLFGAYYTRADIESDIAGGFGPNSGIVREKDTDGHGTHVMGIAAGDGTSSSAGMIGVAPGAQIISVKTPFYTPDILSGVRYIFDQAEQAGLPAVVNLSLGGQDGPHDGTSLFEQGLDELLDRPGRAIVVSAGNEGDQGLHVGHFLSGDTFTFSVDPGSDSLDMSLWYPGGSAFTITVTPPIGSPLTVTSGSTGNAITPSGTVSVDNASGGQNPNNHDNEVLITLSALAGGAPWGISVTDAGGGGRFDGWITSAEGRIIGGDTNETIDEPGNAKKVITVGSFNTKARWSSLAGEQDFSSSTQVGDLSYFSSIGPTRDGRQKPEISAPGAWICSTLSPDSPPALYLSNPDGMHTMNLGTSMAAPHVAGTIALMFSIDPQLPADQIKTILTTTAMRDTFTASVPSARWGWGKLNTRDAVDAVVSQMPAPPGAVPIVNLVENPVVREATFNYRLPEEATEAGLRVITVSGESVLEAALPVAGNSYTWNLLDRAGRALADGLYLYVITTDVGNSAVGRLVISR
ncbi:MAG TPA: hypothetical protein ENL30_02065 [Candidatus Acetothermia bacterium]|nr:hypothetical protein [Candidatus Acetothermia bacterium]